jgi:hypothetical protein
MIDFTEDDMLTPYMVEREMINYLVDGLMTFFMEKQVMIP